MIAIKKKPGPVTTPPSPKPSAQSTPKTSPPPSLTKKRKRVAVISDSSEDDDEDDEIGKEIHISFTKRVIKIGKKVMEETGEKRSSFYLFQNISIAIQRGNASCVLGTIPHSEGLDEIFEFVTFGDDLERSEGSGT